MRQHPDEQRLIDRLAKIEALFSRPGCEGERAAAGSARERILARLEQFERQESVEEFQFSMPDGWSKRLFLALLRRYGIKPYRYRGQRRTTVMARMTPSFSNHVLWPEFQELNAVLHDHLDAVTTRVIGQAIHSGATEAEEVAGRIGSA